MTRCTTMTQIGRLKAVAFVTYLPQVPTFKLPLNYLQNSSLQILTAITARCCSNGKERVNSTNFTRRKMFGCHKK